MEQTNFFSGMTSTSKITRKNGMTYTIRSNRSRFFYPEEWIKFYDALKDNQKVTFMFLISLGCRINEARNIKVSDIDFGRNAVIVRVTKSRNKDGSVRPRIIPISSKFAKYLKKEIADNNLKPEDTFGLLSTPAANIGMKKALQKAGFKDYMMFSVHNVRKTLETWLIALDIDSLKVVSHFGHTLTMALGYYTSPDTFTLKDKQTIRLIIGDLYQSQLY